MRLLTLSIIASIAAIAAPGAQVDFFPAKDIRAMAQTLRPSGATSADKKLAQYDKHYLLLVKREETGSSEIHEHEADIFIVQSGEGAIVTGGKLENGHPTKPGEIRGSGITGGEHHALATGDIIHIAAGVPHQLQPTKGKPFTYFVVKVSGQ